MAWAPIVEVVEEGEHGPAAVSVRVARGRGAERAYGPASVVRIDDVFRDRQQTWKTLMVSSFYGRGENASIRRNSSKRCQSVRTARLVTDYERVS